MNPSPRALLSLLLVVTPSCAEAFRSRPRDEPGGMFIESCSLACNRGVDGIQVFCSTVNTHQNRDIVVRLSQPIDPASVDPSTFRVVEAATGVAASGQLILNPVDEAGVIFRPSLSFDGAGAPVFGLRAGVAYRISVPGERQGDPGPYLRSRAGSPNESRLDCTIVPDQGVLDLVPGPPSVEVFADVVTAWDSDGNPTHIEQGLQLPRTPADLVGVHRLSPLRFVFADLMNPATLASSSSGAAPFVRVEVDGDGSLDTREDRSAVPGRFEVHMDRERLSTELTFYPGLGYPSAGSPGADGADGARAIVVTIPSTVTDLVGNGVPVEGGGGQLAFVPERIGFGPVLLPDGEGVTFEHEVDDPSGWGDAWRTGAEWGAGRLRPGFGSGSGRHGELVVRAGQTVVLDTDHQELPLGERSLDVCGNRDVSGNYPGEAGAFAVVHDGVFEFSALRIESSARLVVRGRRPARLLVSGPVVVHEGGVLDISGETPQGHDSSITLPELGIDVKRVAGDFVPSEVTATRGRGGPGAGDGGFGGDRHDFGPYPEMFTAAGLHGGSDARDLTGFVVDPRGRRGMGVGGDSGVGGGRGGARTRAAYPVNRSTLPDVSGSSVGFNVLPFDGDDACLARQLGGSGSGGGHATDGMSGRSLPQPTHSDYPIGALNAGPPTPGGQVPPWFLGPPGSASPARRLAGEDHEFLRGGAGGGGGGSHCYQTRAAGLDGSGAHACIGVASPFIEWHDHSGSPGGGGGGACKLSSARSIQIDGVLDASGGDGGSYSLQPDGRFALPGGGGAGGGVRVQGEHVRLGPQPGRIDVTGGDGGRFFGSTGVHGGAGGTGLVRIEDRAGELDRQQLATAILPFDPIDGSLRWLSVGSGEWEHDADLPECVSAATSCWIRPEGLFYTLAFLDDRGADPGTQGWNMDLEWSTGSDSDPVHVPFRGTNPWYLHSLETELGNLVGDGAGGGGSAIAVRFQGARARTVGSKFCEQPLDGSNRAVQEGTVTPWVSHPIELNRFEPRPDMVRFTVIFDPTAPAWTADGRTLLGIDRVWIRAQPD